ncbi:MAG: PKD domain-containing protein [Chloroflexota bacterium]
MAKSRRWVIVFALVSLLLGTVAGVLWGPHSTHADRLIPLGFSGTSHNLDLSVAYDQATHTLSGEPTDLGAEGSSPFDAVMHPNEAEIWMAGFTGDGVVILDAQTNAVIDRIPAVGDTPVDIEFSKDGSLAYVSNRNSQNIVVIDAQTRQLLDTIPITSEVDSNLWAGMMSLNPCTGELYMVNYFDGELWRIDPEAGEVTEELLGLGTTLWNPMVDPQAERLYVTDRERLGDLVHVIDITGPTFEPITSIPVGDDPWGIDVSLDGQTIVVANEDSNNLQIIDAETLTVTKSITLTVPGSDDTVEPRDVEISKDGRFAYAPSNDVQFAEDEDAILVVDLETGEQVEAIMLGDVRKPVIVSVAPPPPSLDPIPSFTVSGAPAINQVIQFMDTSGNGPTAWAWDFGDGVGSSTLQNPIYNYANPGTYTVTLTATNHCGSQTTTLDLEVTGSFEAFLPIIRKP